MSIGKKIFGVVFLLVAVALVISVVSIIGLRRLDDSTTQMEHTANRSESLVQMERIAQERVTATLRILVNTDPAEIKRVKREDFGPTEEAMVAALETYARNLPSDADAEVKRRPAKIRELWDAYVDASREVVTAAERNTNAGAIALVHEIAPFWAVMDEDIETLANAITADTGPEAVAWRGRLREARTDFAYYRYADLMVITAETPEKARQYLQIAQEHFADALATLKDGERLPGDIGAKARSMAAAVGDRGAASMKAIHELGAVNSDAEAMALYRGKSYPALRKMNEYVDERIEETHVHLAAAKADASRLADTVTWTAILVAVLGITLAAGFAYVIVSRLTRQLDHVIRELDSGAEQVSAASGEISSASQSLAEGATEQAASLEETSSALEEMASMTRQNADNATRTSTSTTHTVNLIGAGTKAVGNMATAMAEITDSADQIGRIIKTIEDIAFQTNLLALNAAVEAARAGEAGKGFAVVADEVRNLSQRSAQAARDTAQLIEGTVTRVRNGSQIATELDASFKEIDTGAKEAGKLVSEISNATREQAQGVDQVNTAVAQMDKVTQQNAASAEECASASEELSAQAQTLKGVVDDLVALVTGARRRDAAPTVTPFPAGRTGMPFPARRPRGTPSGPTPRRLAAPEAQNVVKANEVIPLDGDTVDFKDL
jgi:CHASE3 domain sensor protein